MQRRATGVLACQCDLIEAVGIPQPGWAQALLPLLDECCAEQKHQSASVVLKNNLPMRFSVERFRFDKWRCCDGALTRTPQEGKRGSFIFHDEGGIPAFFSCYAALIPTQAEVLILTDDSSCHSRKARPQLPWVCGGKKCISFLWNICVSGYKIALFDQIHLSNIILHSDVITLELSETRMLIVPTLVVTWKGKKPLCMMFMVFCTS